MTLRYFALAGAVTALEVTDLGTMTGASDVIFQIIDGLTLTVQVEVKVIKLATLMVDRLLGISKAATCVIELLAQEHRGGAYCLEFVVELGAFKVAINWPIIESINITIKSFSGPNSE